MNSDEIECHCDMCGEPHEMVRPGKAQPTCECHLICEKCGRMQEDFWELEPHPDFPRYHGCFCRVCGPWWSWDIPGESR